MRRAYLDACIVIYLLEDVPDFSERVRRFLAANSDAVLCTSPLVRLEVLVKPLRESNLALVGDYEDFLAALQVLPIDAEVFDQALQLRVRHSLKTPDALHLAAALRHGCTEFWTNDDRLSAMASTLSINILSA